MRSSIIRSVFLKAVTLLLSGYFTLAEDLFCMDNSYSTISEYSGTIQTRPELGTYYTGDLHCYLHITAPEGQRIHVYVKKNYLRPVEVGSDCYDNDHLAVSVLEDFPSEDHRTHNSSEFCIDNASNLKYFTSVDNDLYLAFISTNRDNDINEGLVLEYQFFDERACAPGWVEDDLLLDASYCYKIRTEPINGWRGAQEYCRYEQSNLVSFADDRERRFVLEMMMSHDEILRDDHYWIGLHDIQHEDAYVWIDETYSTALYNIGDPTESGEHCVALAASTGYLMAELCSARSLYFRYAFICKSSKYGRTVLYDPPSDDKEPDDDSSTSFLSSNKIWYVVAVVFFIVCFGSYMRDKVKKKRAALAARTGVENIDIPLRQEFGMKSEFEAATGEGASPYFTQAQSEPSGSPPPYEEAVKML